MSAPHPIVLVAEAEPGPSCAAAELRRLRAAITFVGSPRPLEEVLVEFVSAAMGACGAQAGSVWLYAPAHGALEYAASIGLPEEYIRAFRRCEVGSGACGRVVETRAPVVVHDSQTDPCMAQVKEVALRAGVRGLFSVPILAADGSPLGSLANHFAEPRGASAEDVERNLSYAALIGAFLERRRSEAQLVELARAQERARQREDALAVIAHELRSPVSAILANASVMRRRAAPAHEDVQRPLGAIERSARRLSTILDDLLDLSALEGGRFTLHPRPVRLSELVRDVLDTFRAGAAERSIDLQSSVAADGEVTCDRDRIFQVLSNLVGNAIKFTPDGGVVALAAAAGDGQCELSVTDSGIGLSRDEQEHVFERFWRGRNTSAKGFGLGLSIARGIVEAHGGTLRVTSEPGAGATFSFVLPTRAVHRGPEAP